MAVYNKILVAGDSSAEANQVLRAASSIAGSGEAELTVLHVAEHPDMAYGQWLVYLPIDETQIQARLLERLKERVADTDLRTQTTAVEFGRPVDMIIETALRLKSDLIIIGSHGRHGIRLVLGSTANAVLHRAECDVLAVRVRDESEA